MLKANKIAKKYEFFEEDDWTPVCRGLGHSRRGNQGTPGAAESRADSPSFVDSGFW
jgi:hypothetical protein